MKWEGQGIRGGTVRNKNLSTRRNKQMLIRGVKATALSLSELS